ncbi:MAG: DUF177 domain-containing protein [Ruminococcaceae bacterium]|nr:DUF177 domain-containing protein [Oscillospiraceae bacterium]
MNLDLRPMLRGETNRIDIDFLLEPENLDGVVFPEKAHIIGEITNRGGYMKLVASAEIPYQGECARCLDPVASVYVLPFERTVVTEGTLTEEQKEDNVDEFVIIQGGFLDIDDAVREALILSFPMRLLCSEDCPGLCPKCGKPKREGACGCSEKEIDPRWAVLASLRFDEEEDTDGTDKS